MVAGSGVWKFFFGSGVKAAALSQAQLAQRLKKEPMLVVDHGMRLPYADILFVHNLVTEANGFLHRADFEAEVALEKRFFAELSSDTLVIANSQLVKAALERHFGLSGRQVLVQYPGFDDKRFNLAARDKWRDSSRKALGFTDEPVLGFVTSGDFHKRGLDLLLGSAALILRQRPDVRFFVVGSKKLPAWAVAHPLIKEGLVRYRPKSGLPQRWLAALDIFLYPARFEEFGMVVSEAQAMGIPVLTSRRVGASECLPAPYQDWLLEEPVAEGLADKALALLADPAAQHTLAEAGVTSIGRFDQAYYIDTTLKTILTQKR
ncbi:glycosyltransferase family 4 protein [Gallaecimonas kandeliae]|uniref:glycosyltransferase family 4 protein n=1 Tax=Gallaecimonas kandeliae TaxID=3029055 RepID=UPI002648E2E8|nr:glycosyltransferase family 4 protein [Gallaecimonas kandeliae]WKE65808.1 glycosyltransferase family 4 protein [Gallaecimonas kandeliae]